MKHQKKKKFLNKRLLIGFIFLILIIILILTMSIFSKKPKQETQTFDKISGFTFDYPIFKDWEVKTIKKINENEYVISFNWPSNIRFDDAPQILVIKIDKNTDEYMPLIKLKNKSIKKDSEIINYSYVFHPGIHPKDFKPSEKDWDYIEFYANEFKVRISRFSAKEHGFDDEIFYDKIIETFKFNEIVKEDILFNLNKKFNIKINQTAKLEDTNLSITLKKINKDNSIKLDIHWPFTNLEKEVTLTKSSRSYDITKNHILELISANASKKEAELKINLVIIN